MEMNHACPNWKRFSEQQNRQGNRWGHLPWNGIKRWQSRTTSFMMTILFRAAVLLLSMLVEEVEVVDGELLGNSLCLTITMMSLSEHQRESVSRFITHWSLIQATVHLVASSSFHGPISPIKAKNFKVDFLLRYKEGVGVSKAQDIITRWKKTQTMMDGWWWKHLPPHREWLSESVDAWMSRQVLYNSPCTDVEHCC